MWIALLTAIVMPVLAGVLLLSTGDQRDAGRFRFPIRGALPLIVRQKSKHQVRAWFLGSMSDQIRRGAVEFGSMPARDFRRRQPRRPYEAKPSHRISA